MTTTVVRSVTLTVLMHIFLGPCGVQCLEPEDEASPLSAAFKLPWRDELCCNSPLVQLAMEEGATYAEETNSSESNLPHRSRCNFRSSMRESLPNKPSGGTCLDVQCRIDESWANLTCELQPRNQPSGTLSTGRMVVRLQRLFVKNNTQVSNPFTNPVVCEGEDSLVCSLSVDPATNSVTMVTVNISNAMAPPVLLRFTALPVKPSPPVNLSHIQTNKSETIIHWKDPSNFTSGSLRYEVQYFSTTHPTRQVLTDQPRVSLDLQPYMKYTIQVRCSSLDDPPLWSNWSKPHFIYLREVTYNPKKVVARTGQNVSVYCVFNDRRMNASSAVWTLNGKELDRSLSHPVSKWVSQITFSASETGIYDLLQCRKGSTPYSQICVQGGFVEINCVTSGDIDAMECKWTNKERQRLTLFYEWASVTCDEMKEKESAGKEVLKSSSSCNAVKSSEKFCTISPLRDSHCYKLWMGLWGTERNSPSCTVRSKPIYISPLDHVKPHQPTNVMAKSKSSGVLNVTWVRPKLPVQSLRFQYRWKAADAENWKVEGPLQSLWGEVVVLDMCKVYTVQVRCMLNNGKGYWSDWSDTVKSIPENSRVPERGPDFWRIRQDAPDRNHSNVTVLFESSFPVSRNSYCVDGFIVQHRYSDGSVRREKISQLSPYSFDWNQEHHTVTVEAFNSLGSSINNMNMTLEKQPQRRCVKSFHVSLINSTCVSLSWSLLDSSSVPQFMVVQWFPQGQQGFKDDDQSQDSWVRLPYQDPPVCIQRVPFFEEYNFYLYPVFSDGEGEPVITSVFRGEPTAYRMLMSIALLCIFLLVTLFISQKRMKKFVWKDVPNPNKCSWAKELDFKKLDSSENLFRSPECLHVLPLLLPFEDISKVIVDKSPNKALIQKPLVSPTHDPAAASSASLTLWFDPGSNHLLDALTTSSPSADDLLSIDPRDDHPGHSDNSVQSTVIYAKVQHPDLQPIYFDYKDGNGNSSSDKGTFSAISSDMLGSVTSELWELDSCHGVEINKPRHYSSSNAMEDVCRTSKQGGEAEGKQEKNLCYLAIKHLAENEETNKEEQRDEKTGNGLLGDAGLHRQDCSVVSHPLDMELQSVATCGFPSLYMPQCRTAPCTGHLPAYPQGIKSHH